MKKFIGLLLTSIIIISSLSTLSYANAQNIKASSWAKEEVTMAIVKDLVPKEMLDDDLTQNITRAESAAIAVKLYEAVSGIDMTQFIPMTLVPIENDYSNNEYKEYISKAYWGNIVNGTAMRDNYIEISPDTDVTREQLATMLARTFEKYAFGTDDYGTEFGIDTTNDYSTYYLDYTGVQLYEDTHSINNYAYPSVYFLTKRGIINGIGENIFAPDSTATKEQAILMSLRCYNKLFTDQVINNAKYEVTFDCKEVYSKYASKNPNIFEQYALTFDLNDDNTPELYSVSKENTHEYYMHEFRDGNVIVNPTEFSIYPNEKSLIDSKTFTESPNSFCAIFRSKTTGQKAIISCYADKDIFDITTYDATGLKVEKPFENENYKNLTKYQIIDKVMNNYNLSDDAISYYYLLRGIYDPDTIMYTTEGIINSYLTKSNNKIYDELSKDEFTCYIRNIDIEKGEIELVPTLDMTYEAFSTITEDNKFCELNGIEYCIQTEPDGRKYVYEMPIFKYYFNDPTPENPVSVAYGYTRLNPIKAKINKDMIIRYGVLGHDDNGNPTGYESLGRNQTQTIEEFFSHYAEYSFDGYYKATLKSGELVCLDVMYRP